jgi:hypothetical protein
MRGVVRLRFYGMCPNNLSCSVLRPTKMTKRPLLTLLVVAFLSSSTTAQTTKPLTETNLYYRALFASLDKMDREWGRQGRTDYRNMIVQKNRDITGGLPSQLGDYRVEYLEPQELIDRYKKLRKEFAILVAYPMVNEGERLEITFNVYWISYKKRSLGYALSDWSKVYFRYECDKREYVIDEVKLGGI